MAHNGCPASMLTSGLCQEINIKLQLLYCILYSTFDSSYMLQLVEIHCHAEPGKVQSYIILHILPLRA